MRFCRACAARSAVPTGAAHAARLVEMSVRAAAPRCGPTETRAASMNSDLGAPHRAPLRDPGFGPHHCLTSGAEVPVPKRASLGSLCPGPVGLPRPAPAPHSRCLPTRVPSGTRIQPLGVPCGLSPDTNNMWFCHTHNRSSKSLTSAACPTSPLSSDAQRPMEAQAPRAKAQAHRCPRRCQLQMAPRLPTPLPG